MKTNTKKSVLALMLAGMMAALPTMALAAGEPTNVKNVTVVSKDATTLEVSWEAATDSQGSPADHYRIYYGTQSVQLGAQSTKYEVVVDTPNSNTTYDLTNLTTGVPYYLAITAVDANGVESVEYSVEASGTPGTVLNAAAPTGSEADEVAPTVLNAIAADKNHVLVGFSEKIKLPTTKPETAFMVEEQVNENNKLTVTAAKLYSDDPAGKTVLITTADQTANASYIVTAASAITDMAGNPIKSADGDSALWLGSGLTESSVTQAETDAAAQDLLNQTPNAESAAEDEENQENKQESANQEAENNTTNQMEQAAQETNNQQNTQTQNQETQTPEPTPEPDTTAPEEVSELKLDYEQMGDKFTVRLNWVASPNTKGDLMDQIVYLSSDDGTTYGNGTTLGSVMTTHEIGNLEGGQKYTVKVTTKDKDGNESQGIIGSIELPQTGAGVGLLVLGSAFGANRYLKRKRQKSLQQ